MKKIKIISSSLVLVGMLSLVLLAWCNKELTAGDYTNEIITLKQSKNELMKQVEAIDSNINEAKTKMCALPNAEANRTCNGFIKQDQAAVKTWTVTQELSWSIIK